MNQDPKNWLQAIKLLLDTEKCEYNVYTDTIDDPENNKTVEIERSELISSEKVFKLDEESRQKIVIAFLRLIADNKKEMSDQDLEDAANYLLRSNDLVDTSADCESANLFISILEDLANRKGEEWQKELAELFYYGKPEIGIFRNNAKAREYEPEIEPYEHDDEDICFYHLQIRGTQGQLEAIQKLIAELCEKFGNPDNEFGLYVPVQQVLKKLVGSDEYLGNVISCDLNDDIITMNLECESDVADTLKYAFQCAFGSLDIEVSEEQDMIIEMANLSKEETDLPMIVWIGPNLATRHNKPRMKFSNSNSDSALVGELIPISIDQENPEILIKKNSNFKLKISNKDLENLKKWIVRNYEELMKVWNDIQTPTQFAHKMVKLSQIND